MRFIPRTAWKLLVTLFALLSLGILCSSCAFGDRHVNLTYGSAFDAPTAVGTLALKHVAMAHLQDGRTASDHGGNLLGKVRDGYGIPTADIVGMQDPVLWVSDGIARVLAQEGFDVEKVDAPAAAGNLPVITGTVTQASVGMYLHEEVNIAADLVLERQQQTLGTTSCTGKASRLAWSASAAEFEGVFSEAMTNFLTNCKSTLIPLLGNAAIR